MISRPIDAEVAASATGYAELRRDDLVALCGDLVAAHSVNPPGDTRAAVELVSAFLRASDVQAEVVAVDPTAPNLVARLEGTVPGPHLVMNAHVDTIGAGEETQWTVPPFEMTRRDGRLFGLGMGNMKGALAAMCFAMAFLAGRRKDLRGSVSLTVVSDEVVFGERGAAALLERRPDLLGDALLSGEGPGEMALAVAEKGLGWFEITALGATRQSMLVREGDTPVARLARAILSVDGLNGLLAASPAGLEGLAWDDDALRVSANVGVVEAGEVPNQVASRAVAVADVRIPPGFLLEDLEARLHEALEPIPGLDVRRLRGWDPSWTRPDEPIVRCLLDTVESVRGARPPLVTRLPASDATRWRRAGVPAVCFGPQPTTVAGVDDHAVLDDVVDCAAIYALAGVAFGASAADA